MISRIENIICLSEGVNPVDIHCKSRLNGLKETRQIIMYFAKRLYPAKTWAEISAYFDLDHATAMHAYHTIQNIIDTDKVFREKMNNHNKRLKAIKIDKLLNDATINFQPLEFEVLKLENKINELKAKIELIKIEISEII